MELYMQRPGGERVAGVRGDSGYRTQSLRRVEGGEGWSWRVERGPQ